ncbi:hypothetical protein RHGRI_000115 [Rhododendron griersonianum]|uniref:Uncharacterized protein n=1 Tax=Rhododendron griersonianum TaxID=479676 RepID=A0AAV6LGG4_9ERIC|nr:hypothetical protein RHGRI_000115 [Rhododendron griersonianum]
MRLSPQAQFKRSPGASSTTKCAYLRHNSSTPAGRILQRSNAPQAQSKCSSGASSTDQGARAPRASSTNQMRVLLGRILHKSSAPYMSSPGAFSTYDHVRLRCNPSAPGRILHISSAPQAQSKCSLGTTSVPHLHLDHHSFTFFC